MHAAAGFTSLKFHSHAGSWPLGAIYHSCVSRMNCALANSGSIRAKVTQWKHRSHEAYQGNSQLSGMERMSALFSVSQSALRPCRRCGGGGGLCRIALQPLRDIVAIILFVPDHPRQRLPLHAARVRHPPVLPATRRKSHRLPRAALPAPRQNGRKALPVAAASAARAARPLRRQRCQCAAAPPLCSRVRAGFTASCRPCTRYSSKASLK